MKRNVVHISAYVNGNLGDDLFIRLLCNKYKACKFILVGEGKEKYLFSDINNLHYICGDRIYYKVLTKVYNLLKKRKNGYTVYRDKLVNRLVSRHCTLSVLISGSIYIESPTRLKELKMEYNWYSKHPIIMGCNFGPYKTEEFYDTCKQYFKMARHVSFRDEFSYRLFQDLDNVSFAPDIVFNMEHKTEDKGYYTITVMDFETVDYGNWKEYSKEYIKKLAELASNFTAKGIPIVLVSFCDELGDGKAAEQVRDAMENSNLVTLCSYSKVGMKKSIDVLANAKGIIASRYHALVIGILFQKQVYPICYSKKMENLLSYLGLKSDTHYVDTFIKTPNDEVIEGFIDMSKVDVEQLKKAASAHFDELDILLN